MARASDRALTAALDLSGAWTPIRPIKNGNWNPPVVLVGLASLILARSGRSGTTGACSSTGGYETNPNYWYYEIPYVDAVHLFSEMPILGYLGYLPFGFLAWVCWLIVANIYRLPRHFDLTRCQLPGDAKT